MKIVHMLLFGLGTQAVLLEQLGHGNALGLAEATTDGLQDLPIDFEIIYICDMLHLITF